MYQVIKCQIHCGAIQSWWASKLPLSGFFKLLSPFWSAENILTERWKSFTKTVGPRPNTLLAGPGSKTRQARYFTTRWRHQTPPLLPLSLRRRRPEWRLTLFDYSIIYHIQLNFRLWYLFKGLFWHNTFLKIHLILKHTSMKFWLCDKNMTNM